MIKKIDNPEIEAKFLFKCGHMIIVRVRKYMLSDPSGIMYETALKGGKIVTAKICSMCREDKRWKLL